MLLEDALNSSQLAYNGWNLRSIKRTTIAHVHRLVSATCCSHAAAERRLCRGMLAFRKRNEGRKWVNNCPILVSWSATDYSVSVFHHCYPYKCAK